MTSLINTPAKLPNQITEKHLEEWTEARKATLNLAYHLRGLSQVTPAHRDGPARSKAAALHLRAFIWNVETLKPLLQHLQMYSDATSPPDCHDFLEDFDKIWMEVCLGHHMAWPLRDKYQKVLRVWNEHPDLRWGLKEIQKEYPIADGKIQQWMYHWDEFYCNALNAWKNSFYAYKECLDKWLDPQALRNTPYEECNITARSVAQTGESLTVGFDGFRGSTHTGDDILWTSEFLPFTWPSNMGKNERDRLPRPSSRSSAAGETDKRQRLSAVATPFQPGQLYTPTEPDTLPRYEASRGGGASRTLSSTAKSNKSLPPSSRASLDAATESFLKGQLTRTALSELFRRTLLTDSAAT